MADAAILIVAIFRNKAPSITVRCLFTAPGSFSERDELRALGRVLKAHGARYSSYIRDVSDGVHEVLA